MSADPRDRPAMRRVAYILEVDQSELVDLETIPDDDLDRLHEQINHVLFGQGKAAFARVANLTRTIPAPLAAKLAERFLPPVLAARVAEQLPPTKARDLVDRVSLDYLCDIAVALDPVGARPVIQQIPDARIGEVAGELFSRGDYAAMAEFARSVTVEGLLAAFEQACPTDLAQLLPMLEWSPELDGVLEALPSEKLDDAISGLTAEQLADLAVSVDLEPLRPILESIETDAVEAVTRELFARQEYDALANLATACPPHHLATAIDVAGPGDLEAIVPLLQPSPELEAALNNLPAERRAALAETFGEAARRFTDPAV